MSLNNAGVFRAGGTIAPMRFVVLDTAADNQVLEASATTVPIVGISQVGQRRAPGLPGSDVTIAAQSGDAIEVYSLGDVAPVQLMGTTTRGDLLQSNGLVDGRAKTVAPGAGGEVGGRALQSGTANQIIMAQILCRPA